METGESAPITPETQTPEKQMREYALSVVDKYNMPGITARIFTDRWTIPEDEAQKKFGEGWKGKIEGSAIDAIRARVDSERTGLELEVALREEFSNDIKNKVIEFNGVVANGDIRELIHYVGQQLTAEDRVALAADINAWRQGDRSVDAPEYKALVKKARKLLLKSEESHYAFISGDLQKLKACNDFGESQIEGMDGQRYVDEFGFKELGRRFQALTSILGSDEYRRQLNSLEGKTRHNPLDNFKKEAISREYYETQVREICDQELIQYCIDNGINILPAAKRSAGDEMTFMIKKNRLPDGKANSLTDEDLRVVEKLIAQASHVDVGVYTPEDADFKRVRAKEIFQSKYALPEGDIRVGFSNRVGGYRADSIFEAPVPDSAKPQEQKTPQQEWDETINAQLDRYIGHATTQMETNKRAETMNFLYEALQGNPDSQLLITLLIEQARFPGDVNQLKDLVREYEGKEISRELFDTVFMPALERRYQVTNRTKFRYPGSILE